MELPRDNLVRTSLAPMQVRAGGDDGNTLYGHFTVFGEWTEINSMWEGHFLERNAKGMLDRTLRERGPQVRVLVDHGTDPSIGNKPLGTVRKLRGDAYYEVDLFDVPYVRDLRPALAAGQYGASYRFRVVDEEVVQPKRATSHNPAMLPERTITDVDLYEFGPVMFPAYESASAGLRSWIRSTDEFVDALRDPAFVARLTERLGPKTVENIARDMSTSTTYNAVDALTTWTAPNTTTSNTYYVSTTSTRDAYELGAALALDTIATRAGDTGDEEATPTADDVPEARTRLDADELAAFWSRRP